MSEFYKIANVLIIVGNVILILIPKKTVSNVHSNAAGTLSMIAIGLAVVYLIHIVLFIVAIYFNKMQLLRILTFIYMPITLSFL
ncbi:MAG: hypothetical protein HC811_05285 [Flammeovirgaceae bacterium]|nr:hypothetical protein [Flammeovirgaceae bacterium]